MRTTLLLAMALAGCIPAELIDPAEPKQVGVHSSMSKRGAKSFAQRQRDCWDMPNAEACHEVGLNHELGLAGPSDRGRALEYYDKACAISQDPEHCDAARRLRDAP
jgi:hypothetical protein